IAGIVVVGDRPTVIAARVAEQLGLPWHPPPAAAIARNKLLTRERLRDAGMNVPWFHTTPLGVGADACVGPGRTYSSAGRKHASAPTYPCVLKPVALSGSRGVMRANDERELEMAFERLRALMRSPDVRAERNEAHDTALVEGFVP